MSRQSTTYLIEQLISSKLSKEELEQFLAGLENEDVSQAYSDLLEAYFMELLQQHEVQSEPDKQTEP